MLQSLSFAVILDMTVVFNVWHVRNVLVIFWTGMALYSAIAISTASLGYYILRLNHPRRKKPPIMQFSSAAYNFLKKAAQIYIPALGTLYFALAQIWHLPAPEEVVGSVMAVDTFLGVVLQISSTSYNNDPSRLAGTLKLEEDEDGATTMRLIGVDPQKLLTHPEVTFKMVGSTPPTS